MVVRYGAGLCFCFLCLFRPRKQKHGARRGKPPSALPLFVKPHSVLQKSPPLFLYFNIFFVYRYILFGFICIITIFYLNLFIFLHIIFKFTKKAHPSFVFYHILFKFNLFFYLFLLINLIILIICESSSGVSLLSSLKSSLYSKGKTFVWLKNSLTDNPK